jgi:putative FmdB family regulatory protein
MPTYEYECESCERRLTEFHGMNDPALSTCPDCGGPLRRLVSGGAGVLMKGRSGGGANPACDRTSPCCGRDEPCERRPCA